MEPWLIWLIATGILLIAEMLTSAVWFLCIAIGTLFGLIASLCDGGTVVQVVTMAAGTILALVFIMPRIKKIVHRRSTRADATNADAMIGRQATVTHDIVPGRLGRVKLDGDSWQARAKNPDCSYPAGSVVTIHAIDSIILTVE